MIYKATLIALFLTITIAGKAQENKVQWLSFEEAVKQNEQAPKKILVDVYTDWCGWCKKMKKQTFNHPDIAQYINKNFYPVRFDAESKKEVQFKGKTFSRPNKSGRQSHELAVALLRGRMSYPSVAYLDGQNRLITAVPGYYSPKDMEPILKYFVTEAYKEKSFEDFKKDFRHSLID